MSYPRSQSSATCLVTDLAMTGLIKHSMLVSLPTRNLSNQASSCLIKSDMMAQPISSKELQSTKSHQMLWVKSGKAMGRRPASHRRRLPRLTQPGTVSACSMVHVHKKRRGMPAKGICPSITRIDSSNRSTPCRSRIVAPRQTNKN